MSVIAFVRRAAALLGTGVLWLTVSACAGSSAGLAAQSAVPTPNSAGLRRWAS